VPLRGIGQGHRRCGEAFIQHRIEGVRLDAALQLPDAKPYQQRKHHRCENGESAGTAPDLVSHRNAPKAIHE
jgi:hypothetical protein